jgi:hypothetical protein
MSRGTRTSSQSPRIAERGPRTLLPIPGPRVAVRGLRLRVHVSRNAVPGFCFRSRDHESRYADFVSESTYSGTRSPDFASVPGPRVAVRGLRLRVHVSRNAVSGLCSRSRDHETRYASFVSESAYHGTRSPDFASDPGTTSRGTRTSSQSPRIAERGLWAPGAPARPTAPPAPTPVDAGGSLHAACVSLRAASPSRVPVVRRAVGKNRAFIPAQSILETIASGSRTTDPQKVADQFLYSIGADLQWEQRRSPGACQ